MDKLTARLTLYLIMQHKGYLSIAMVIDLLRGLSDSMGLSYDVVVDEFNNLHGRLDIENSTLDFYVDNIL
jgi:hypothetical protein